jgi:hypothetical protein
MGKVGFFGPVLDLFFSEGVEAGAPSFPVLVYRKGGGFRSIVLYAFAFVSAFAVSLRSHHRTTLAQNPQSQSNAKAKTWPKSPTLDKPEDGAPTPKDPTSKPSQNLYCSVNTNGVIIPQNGAGDSDGKYGEGKPWATRR